LVNRALNKRITLFCGHYGSGKTNIAVNFAIAKKKTGLPVSIADIDIVNPYFRTKDSTSELESAGVSVVALPFANTSVDLPAIPSEVMGLVSRRDSYVVMDVGGDDRGAVALGRYAPTILAENNFDMVFVVNFYRPLTRTPAEALEIMREIEAACKIPFTAIINNSNIGAETSASDVLKTAPLALELADMANLPLVATTADEKLCEDSNIGTFFGLKLQEKLF